MQNFSSLLSSEPFLLIVRHYVLVIETMQRVYDKTHEFDAQCVTNENSSSERGKGHAAASRDE